MKRFETIIEKEKEASYTQRDKDRLRFHILILIQQEQESKKQTRRLYLGLILGIGMMSFLYSPLIEIANKLIIGLGSTTESSFVSLVAFSYLLTMALFLLLKKPESFYG